VLDQDAPHDHSGDSEEVGPVGPIDLRIIRQPDVQFVDEDAGGDGVAGAFSTQPVSRDTEEVAVDLFDERGKASPIALVPRPEKSGDGSWGIPHQEGS